jgi:hypothetical protein
MTIRFGYLPVLKTTTPCGAMGLVLKPMDEEA